MPEKFTNQEQQQSENNLRKIEGPDLDIVSGGAKIVPPESASAEKFLEKESNQMCNCDKFQPHTPGLKLNVCENCRHARKTDKNSKKLYCVQQPIVIS